MRVLWIVEAAGGGTARHALDLAAGLAREGVEVHLFFNPRRADAVWRRGKPRAEAAGVRLLPLSMRAWPEPMDAARVFGLLRYLRERGPFDLVHGHSSKGGVLARALRRFGGPPAVYTPHAFASLRPGIGGRLAAAAERMLAPYTDALIAVSPDEAAEAERLGYPSDRVHVIPNGLDPEDFSPLSRREARARLGLPEAVRVVGFLGRFEGQKDPLLLLEAFALIGPDFPDALLALAGGGPLAPRLKARARSLGIESRVRFLGFRAPEEALPAFDLLALPSRYEGMPYVLLEALWAGVSVVATQVGGASFVLGEVGLLVPPGDRRALAGALARLLADAGERGLRARAARARAARFSLRRMVSETLLLYRRIGHSL